MPNPGVHWYEGLFLRPQHFQANDRYWADTLHTSESWDHPYSYGIYDIDFSREALKNHQFQLTRIRARMRDGTLISLDTGQEPDRIDLKQPVDELDPVTLNLNDAFDSDTTVRVFIGVSKLQLGRPNVDNQQQSGPVRFFETTQNMPDESEGGDEEPIQFRTLNVRLLLSTEDLSGYEYLPIAQIKRATAGEAVPRLDEDYFPPVISIDAWPGLSRDIVRSVTDVMGQKIDVLSQQVTNRAIGLDSRDAGDADRVLMLTQLNIAYAALTGLLTSHSIHPLTAYVELCRVVGQLSIFDETRRVAELPPYDHDNLARVFKELRVRIERLINTVRAHEYEQRPFVGVGMGMQVSLEPKWFNADWEWYIGVNKGDLTAAECRELLSSGQLDWKFGSSRQVELLFKQRAEGLRLIPLDRPVRALPLRPEWLYYEVPRRESHAWRDVQETQTLAMRLRDSLIVNNDRLQGERRLTVSSRGTQATLEFALFAVPKHQ